MLANTSEALKHSFVKIISQVSFDIDERCPMQLWQDLQTHYTQSHRHYHTLTHLKQMFDLFDDYRRELNHPSSVALAIWYHDVIYEPIRSDNERQSADYFKREFKNILPDLIVDRVDALIMMTADHQLTDDSSHLDIKNDAEYFLDMDLAILGKCWIDYEQYAQLVRLEYSDVPLETYSNGRMTVLRRFLDRERLYFSQSFFERLEEKARDNIQREIQQLYKLLI